MKTVYTESAQLELEQFVKRQQKVLEGLVSERKHIFGDDVIEITASDIKEASKLIQPIKPVARSTYANELITRVYVILGVAMMAGAFVYPDIQEMLAGSTTQGFMLLVGAAMTFVGLVFGYWLKVRKRRYDAAMQELYSAKFREFVDTKLRDDTEDDH